MVETGTVALVAAREAVLSLAARLDYPEVVYGGGRLAGQADYERAASERPGFVLELLGALEDIRASRQQQAEYEARERDYQEAHSIRLMDFDNPDLEAKAELQRRKERAEEAARRAMPASHGDMADVLEVLRSIQATLEGRRG